MLLIAYLGIVILVLLLHAAALQIERRVRVHLM